ncbi:MAG: hypothetical protein KDA25_08575 [Phycisphaerales bacterium]|nr:hypothetical protein [Phycisphaerales bacterium]
MPRDYETLVAAAPTRGTRDERLRLVTDLLWDALHPTGVSWCGFYVEDRAASDAARLVLACCRDAPACSPIGLHGVCGQSYISRATRIVEDVSALGAHYIACDPRDRSEIVVPCLDASGACWGVLDVDSWDLASFDVHDDAGLRRVLRAAQLTT